MPDTIPDGTTSRLVSAESTPEDVLLRPQLKPKGWDGFVGQVRAVSLLQRSIEAAQRHKERLDNVLFYGPPGLGKTTLADLVMGESPKAAMMGSSISDVLAFYYKLRGLYLGENSPDFIFIDEIHSAKKRTLEILYPILEDDPNPNRTLFLKGVTIIGATTKPATLPEPFRDRFGLVIRLDYYNPEELTILLNRNAPKMNVELEDKAASFIGQISRGTPRIGNRLLKRIRDFSDTISLDLTKRALEELGLDNNGLDETERKLLYILQRKFQGGPVAARTLAEHMGEETKTLTDYLEPYLIRAGYIQITSRGRVLNKYI